MRFAPLLLLFAVAGAGCRTPAKPLPAVPPLPIPTPPNVLPAVAITPFEPDYATLPRIDGKDALPGERKPPRGIEEASVAAFAGGRSTTAALLDQENTVPKCDPGADLLRDVRAFAAAEARNRAVGDALASFFQLAEADGRADLLRQSLKKLADLRATAEKAKAEGARVPVDPEDLDQQRAQTLGVLGLADLGADLLEIDLLRRLGLPGKAGERLRPTGKFDLDPTPPDPDAAVKFALETRADLQALRMLYLRLNADNLPSVREYLRGTGVGGGLVGPTLPGANAVIRRRLAKIEAEAAAAVAAEVEVRRRQLFVVIEEKERGTADEVRAAALAVAEQARQVGLARGRAERAIEKLADLKRQTKGPFLEVPAEVEVLRARADVIAGVMAWHQARVRLRVSQGAYNAAGATAAKP